MTDLIVLTSIASVVALIVGSLLFCFRDERKNDDLRHLDSVKICLQFAESLSTVKPNVAADIALARLCVNDAAMGVKRHSNTRDAQRLLDRALDTMDGGFFNWL